MVNSYVPAQTITDVNFATAIRAVCPTCIDGTNVLLPPTTTLTTLDVSGQMIVNLTGMGGFTALQTRWRRVFHYSFTNFKTTLIPTLKRAIT